MSSCISPTGRMRRKEEEEVGMGRKPGCWGSQTQKASSVKAGHENLFLPNKQERSTSEKALEESSL